MEHRVFILTMPNNNAWNGKWTGQGRLFCIVNKYKNKDPVLENINKSDSHYYDFEDGWGALVKIKKIDAIEAKVYKKQSCGFSSYSWMVKEIEQYGRILTRKERHERRAESA